MTEIQNEYGPQDKSIILVGLMGAGKTSVGRHLAEIMDLPFKDSDHEIELAANMSVSEIFNKYGEPHFRDGERKVIARLLEDGPMVLSLGGGAYMDEVTRSNIKNTGISVWLKADFDVLWERVSKKGHRPLLKTSNPQETLKVLLQQRDPIYGLSDLTLISTQDSTQKEMAVRIKEMLCEYHAEDEAKNDI